MYKYFPHTDADIQEMLRVIGVASLDDLYAEVPDELRLHRELDIPEAKSELEVRRIIGQLAAENRPLVCFAGCGAYDHYTPAVVPYLAQRSEFSTSYTPYQAEISQGTLQYIFEYQTMMAELTGMDLANASMYDGATATAEAMMMTVSAARKRNTVLVSATLSETIMRVLRTYAHFHGITLQTIPETDGHIDLQAAIGMLSETEAAGVIVQQPNRYGIIEDYTGLADAAHQRKTLLAINTMASALAVLTTPAEWGADIACGDAQSLGLPLAYGGPYCGYMAVRTALVRKMPGRLVGATTDSEGRRLFVLTMQAREQHIRREKATSNICTAQGYMCLYVAIYLSLMGARGLTEVNTQSADAAHYLHDELLKTGRFRDPFPHQPYLLEFTLEYLGTDDVRERLAREGFLLGVPTEGRPNHLTIACTEKTTPDDVRRLLALL